MGIAAVAEELAGSDELEELFRLDASESEPENDEDKDDDDEDDEGEGEGEDEGEGVRPEGMPHD